MGDQRSPKPTAGDPLVVVSYPDGTVVGSNRSARTTLGKDAGAPCWAYVGPLDGAEGLPCSEGCTARLIRSGREEQHPVQVDGRPHTLTCSPVNGKIVSVLAPGRHPSTQGEMEPLTQREQDVLWLLAEGLNSKQIADRLGIGSGTIRTHVEHLRSKLDAPTQAAIVCRAFRLGLLR